MWTLINRNARFARALGAGRDAAEPLHRLAMTRSSERACPLGPIARYKVSMALIWSRPNVACGTRWANEITTSSDRIEVTRVKRPNVNSSEDGHGKPVGWPHPAVRDEPPE